MVFRPASTRSYIRTLRQIAALCREAQGEHHFLHVLYRILNQREADYLGLQYLYKAGYDPLAFVDFFEKIESIEKKKPGTVSKVFSTHPLTDDRIKSAQREIQDILLPKPEYVVNTSEFNDVRNRLAMLRNGRKAGPDQDSNRPSLRRAPGAGSAGDEQEPNKDERPTLKRRDQ
jgi:predicted Zn-dependent protease